MTDQAQHERPFGLWTAVALVVGGVIGGGIYSIPQEMAPLGWSGVAGWAVSGAAAVVIARVLGAVIAIRPAEPGLVALIGEEIGPLASVLVGWSNWTSYWCANAFIALTAVHYGGQLVPALIASPLAEAAMACALLAALAWLNLTSLAGVGQFQVATTGLKLIPLAGVTLIALAGLFHPASAYPAVPRLVPAHDLAFGRVFGAAAVTMAAIVGFESAGLAAARVTDPARNVPRATVYGTILACAVYLVVSTAIDFALTPAEIARTDAPVAFYIGKAWGGWAASAAAAFAMISAIGGLNVWTMLLGEIPMGLARARLVPEWLGRTNRHDVAAVPLLLGTTLAALLLLIGSWNSGARVMDFMLKMTAVTALWLYIFAGLVLFKNRTRRVEAAITIAFCLAVMAGAGADVVGLNLALLASALPLYWLARRAGSLAPAS